MQFGEDWPGVFIRGDNALMYAAYLKAIVEYLEKEGDAAPAKLGIILYTFDASRPCRNLGKL